MRKLAASELLSALDVPPNLILFLILFILKLPEVPPGYLRPAIGSYPVDIVNLGYLSRSIGLLLFVGLLYFCGVLFGIRSA